MFKILGIKLEKKKVKFIKDESYILLQFSEDITIKISLPKGGFTGKLEPIQL